MEGPEGLMARRIYPRSAQHHAVVAGKVHMRHALETGEAVTLPVPIDMIIEKTYGLEIGWDAIPEPPGMIILGALAPRSKRIVLNERHEAMFERWIGPERFTLAHELAHWIYDAENPDQLSLGLDGQQDEVFCYHRESPGLADDVQIREINANKLAAHLLLPEDLVRAASIDTVLADSRRAAAEWKVSLRMLQIRLQELGLIDEHDPFYRRT